MNLTNRLPAMSGRLAAVGMVLAALMVTVLAAVAQEPNLPQSSPDAEVGLAIFVERCAACHGETGEGDGEMAGNLPAPPASLADPNFRFAANPAAMFNQIANGDLSAGMPPFGPGTENSNPIPVATIWDLVAAVYSLSTPAESIATGQVVYQENCSACHGESGAGDGPEAAGREEPGLNLADLSYWFNRSNEAVLEDLLDGDIADHDFSLNEAEQWSVIDYARSFSYAYVDPFAPVPPIEAATIGGIVKNGTTDEVMSGATARLRAFTESFEETLNITTTVGIDGRYLFDLKDTPPDWIFLSSVAYGGFSFSSDAARLSHAETSLDLPITVYDQTTDARAVNIDQIHIIVDFFEGGVNVSELYVISNREAAVFVGVAGQTASGTVELDLPDGAQNIMFERTLGSFDSNIPATEVIQTENGFADTLPLRPGSGALNLVVRYALPYDDGALLSHRVAYDTANVTVILPDAGVSVESGGWTFEGSQELPGSGTFLAYSRSSILAGSTIELGLEGRPGVTTGAGRIAVSGRDQTSELLIGAGVSLIVVGAAVYAIRAWRTPRISDDEFERLPAGEDRVASLLRAIAELDEAYERGEMSEATYSSERSELKELLASLWPGSG